MKKAKLIAGAVLAGSMLASSAAFAGMVDRGTMLANTCAGCHGPGGNSVGPATPNIAGMSKDYFIESMQDYKAGERPGTIMTRIAKGYSEDDIAAMAEYFSTQPYKAALQQANAKLSTKGKKLHDKYCEKCHSESGTLAEDDVGILAGQWKPWLHHSLHDFSSGDREMTKKMAKKFNAMYEKHGEDGLKQLVEYYSSVNGE